MKKDKIIETTVFSLFTSFILLSFILRIDSGMQMGRKTIYFAKNLFLVLPPAFILIGLFQVWVKRESVEKHLGTGSGLMAHLWVTLLAGTTVGGLYVAFPVAAVLFRKGARIPVILTYLGAAAVVRIPMTLFEASFLGIKFSLIRLLISIPLIIVSSEILGKYLETRSYQITDNNT